MEYGGYRHVHVTEREADGSWEDCSWASGVELARAVGQDCPPTRAEYEALRAASGDVATPGAPGSNLNDLKLGMDRRYGWSGTIVTQSPLNLKVGQVAVVTGKMGAWPMGSHWRRWDPTFAGNHAVAVFRIDAGARVWWCDPLAPTGYSGEWMAITELARFTRTLGNRMMVDVMNSRRAPMLGTVTRTPYVGGPARWRVAAGVTINGYDPAQPGKIIKTMTFASPSTAQATADVSVAWNVTPAPVPKGGPFLEVLDGYFAGLLIVKALVSVDVPDDPTPYDKEDLAAAAAQASASNEAKWERWVATHP